LTRTIAMSMKSHSLVLQRSDGVWCMVMMVVS